MRETIECQDCLEGTFSDVVGATACKQCQVGTVSWDSGWSACDPCPNGTAAACTGLKVCSPCDPGQYSDNGRSCEDCPAGTSQPAHRAHSLSSCTPCEIGTYSGPAQSQCKACPSNEISNGVGGLGGTACVGCPAGTTSAVQGGGHYCIQIQIEGLSADDTNMVIWTATTGGIASFILACFLLAWSIRRGACRRRDAFRRLEAADKNLKVGKLREAIAAAEACHVSRRLLRPFKEHLASLEVRYTSYESLVEAVAEGHTRLVRGSWLAYESGHRMRRQQDLPPEAFWRPSELRALVNHVPIIAISYCWIHPVHPDPLGETLRILKTALHLRLSSKGEGRIHDLAIFLDYMSLPQNGESGPEQEPQPGAQRTEEEFLAFRRGLATVNLWYAHQSVSVWLLRSVPARVEHKYEDRGWPYFEQAVAGMITDCNKLMDIDGRVMGFSNWDDLHEDCRAGRRPPIVPDHFATQLEQKHFTNGHDDKEFVARKYLETFEDVVGQTTALWFVDLEWGDEHALQLAATLPFCSQLQQLAIGGNDFTEVGVKAIVQGAKSCPALQGLDLSRNKSNLDDKDELVLRWKSGGHSEKGLRLASLDDRILRYSRTLGWMGSPKGTPKKRPDLDISM